MNARGTKTARLENATAVYLTCSRGKGRRAWKEATVRLEKATVLTIEGPGTEWLCVMRGNRSLVETPWEIRKGHVRRRRWRAPQP